MNIFSVLQEKTAQKWYIHFYTSCSLDALRGSAPRLETTVLNNAHPVLHILQLRKKNRFSTLFLFVAFYFERIMAGSYMILYVFDLTWHDAGS